MNFQGSKRKLKNSRPALHFSHPRRGAPAGCAGTAWSSAGWSSGGRPPGHPAPSDRLGGGWPPDRAAPATRALLCLFLLSLILLLVSRVLPVWAIEEPAQTVIPNPHDISAPRGGNVMGAFQERIRELSDLIRETLQNNPELQAYKERWAAAKARVWQAISWDDTMVGADFEGIPRGRIDADRRNNIEWMISQKIPIPGKRFLRGRVARKEAKMAEADYRAKEREIVSEVKKAYFEYFLREHEVLLHEETKRILERLSKSAEARYATGQIPYHEVLRAHTELAKIANDVAKHYQQRETALARLKSLLSLDPEEPLKISVAVPQRNFSYTREGLMKLALENQPELQAMRYGLQAAKTEVKGAWLDLLPDAEARIEARTFRGESRFREYDQFLGFEVPVLSFPGRIGQIKEKRAESHAAQAAWENMKNMVLFEVQEAVAEFEWEDRTVKIYESSVLPQAESIVDAALAEYETGRGNFLTVMDAQKALAEFRHEYFHSLSMREKSFAELEKVVGTNLGGGFLK